MWESSTYVIFYNVLTTTTTRTHKKQGKKITRKDVLNEKIGMHKPIVERVVPEFVKRKKRQNVFTEKKFRGAKTKDWILTVDKKKQEWKGERMLRRHMIRDESGLFSEEKFVMLRSKKSADGSTRYELTPISQWYKFDLKIQRSESEMSMEQIDAIMKGKMQAREIRARVKPDDDEDQNSKLNGPRFESYRSAFKDPASKSSSSKTVRSSRYGEIDQGSDDEEVEGMAAFSDDEQEDVVQYEAEGEVNVFEPHGSEFDSDIEDDEDENNKSGSGSDSDLMDEDVEMDDGEGNEDEASGLSEPSKVSRKQSTAKEFVNDISRSKRKSQKRSRTSSPVVASEDNEPPPTKRVKVSASKPSSSSRQSEGVKLDNAIRDILIRYGKPIDLKTIMKELKKAGLRPSKKREPEKFKLFIKMIGLSLPRVANMEKMGKTNYYRVKRVRRT